MANAVQGAQPILALHGWLDNLNSFVPLMDELREYNFMAVDLPGHGYSDHKPKGSIYHFIDSIADVIGIADALGLEKFDLMGHSMGAGISSLVASAAPDRVGRLICLEGLGPLSVPEEDIVENVQTHLRQLNRLPSKKYPVYRNAEEALMARLLAADISETAGRLIVERALQPVEGGVTWISDARLRIKSVHPFSEEQVGAFMDGIRCPVLMVRAVPGFPFKEEQLRHRRDRINKR